jgi:imidazolonepropionase
MAKSGVKSKATLFRNIGCLLTLSQAAGKEGRHITEEDLSVMKDAAMVVQGGRIAWIGDNKKIPKPWKLAKEIDLGKKTVLPGLVECHTHSVFAGSRSEEFEMRLQGASYQEIAARGGGILSTMRHTRAASPKLLLQEARERMQNFIRQGVTTVEVKTGYALDLPNEMKCLKVIRSLSEPRVISTFLGAHALPPEFSSVEKYLEFLASEVLPKISKLTRRVDIFVEKGFIVGSSAKAYLEKAKSLGFDLTIHADQLTLSGGAQLAIELAAKSADHVIQLDEEHIKRLAKSSVTAVLLPAADLYMKCAYPPARKLIDAGARVALATDFNPGTSPTQDLALVGLLARLEMKMSLPEVIAAYTVGASHALNLQNEIGSLEVGKSADFFSISKDWPSLFYSPGAMGIEDVYLKGRLIHSGDK